MASRTWTIEPESRQIVPPACYLEETLRRATAAGPFSSLQDQYELITRREVFHRPIRAHALRRAALVGSSFYVRGYRAPLAPEGGFLPRDLVVTTRLKQGALGCTYFGNMFFGHFWTDDVPLMQLGSELGEPVRTARPLTGHQRELLDLLRLRVRLAHSAVFDELIVLDDRGQTSHKEWRYRTTREAITKVCRNEHAPRGVFLFRGASGTARVLVNEQEIADALVPHGVVPVHPEHHSLDELNRIIWGARLVVGVEGSQLLHGFYTAAERAAFLALVPPMRFSNIVKSYTDCLGMFYGFVIGEPCQDGFRVELQEVLRVMDMLETLQR